MHLLVPGSAQMVAGNRAVGRVVLAVWVVLWAIVLAALLTWLVQRAVLVGIATSALGLTVIEVGLLVVAVGWLAVTIDVLRLTRLLRLSAWARPVVAGGLVLAALVGRGRGVVGRLRGRRRPRRAGLGVLDARRRRRPPPRRTRPSTTSCCSAWTGRRAAARSTRRASPSSASTRRPACATIIGVPTTLKDVPFPASSPDAPPLPERLPRLHRGALHPRGRVHGGAGRRRRPSTRTRRRTARPRRWRRCATR